MSRLVTYLVLTIVPTLIGCGGNTAQHVVLPPSQSKEGTPETDAMQKEAANNK